MTSNDKENDEDKARRKRGDDRSKKKHAKIKDRFKQLGSFGTLDSERMKINYDERFKKYEKEVNTGSISVVTNDKKTSASASAILLLTRLESKRRGSVPKFNEGLQAFIDDIYVDLSESGKPLTEKTFREWMAPHISNDNSNDNSKETKKKILIWYTSIKVACIGMMIQNRRGPRTYPSGP